MARGAHCLDRSSIASAAVIGLALLVAALGSLTAGCGGSAVSSGGDAAVGDGASADVALCSDDSQCPPGNICQRGVCVPHSAADARPADSTLPPELIADPSSVDFGGPLVGSEVSREVTLRNIGGSTLRISKVEVSQIGGGSEFSLSPVATPLDLEAGKESEVTLYYKPIDGQADEGELLISSNDPENPSLKVKLASEFKGTALLEVCVPLPAPAMGCVEPAALDFGTVPYGQNRAGTMVIANAGQGNRPLTITKISVSNSNPHFGLSMLVPDANDPNDPNAVREQPMAFPVYLSPEDPLATPPRPRGELRVKVVFTADGVDGLVPAENVVVETDAAAPSDRALVPLKGQIEGCRPAYFNLDSKIDNGCEYFCPYAQDHGAAAASDTTCDGIDDDCDNVKDEDFTTTLTCGVGFCTAAAACVGGTVGCTPGQPGGADTNCDGIDNDCNRQTDEGFAPRTCGTGVCQGTSECKGGVEGCVPKQPAADQDTLCNGLDDDCDGPIDEDYAPVACGLGVCRRTSSCAAGRETACVAGRATGPDEDCNGLDDDCNGKVDDHYKKHTCGVGVCQRDSVCVQDPNGAAESCTPGNPQAGEDKPDDSFQDGNCDGIDGDLSKAIFVDPQLGNDASPGDANHPKQHLSNAIVAADGAQRKYVIMAVGTYSETATVNLRSYIHIYGGYAHTVVGGVHSWKRSDTRGADVSVQQPVAMQASNLSGETILDRITVRAANSTAAGGASIALRSVNSIGLRLNRVDLYAGKGGNGESGESWTQAAASGTKGDEGVVGCEDTDDCGTNGGAGGAHGVNSSCGSANGGNGGSGRDGNSGQHGSASAAGVDGGDGGGANCFWAAWDPDCSNDGGRMNGSNGKAGSTKGTPSAGGNGSAGNNHGSIGGGGAWSTSNGQAGSKGGDGYGGGGGGGGGGEDGVCIDGTGSGGGGGGAGGCGGSGGRAGTGGGASIGVLVYGQSVKLASVVIHTASGGTGGQGRSGQSGGSGAGGGEGGASACDWGSGGDGGSGSGGARGGHGGGGGGGPSIGIALAGNGLVEKTGVTYVLGSGGSGGSSPGNAGPTGVSSQQYNF